MAGSDLWWHLASGRDIWVQASVTSSDPFSHTMPGALWMNHEWLWDVLYWGAYTAHPELPAWLNLGVLLTAFGLAFFVSLRESGSTLAAGIALWLVAAASHWFLDIRPHLFSLLFVGLFLSTRTWKHAPWMWPPLVVLWANTHAGFVFGIGTIGLFVLVQTLESAFAALRAGIRAGPLLERLRAAIPWKQWAAVAACLLGVLINPSGVQILEYPLAYLDSTSPFRGIIEWQSPSFSLDASRFEGRFYWLAALAIGSAVFAARRAPYLVALAAVTLMMAGTSRRFIPLFGITAMPLLAVSFAALIGAARSRLPALERPSAGWATAALALGVAALLWRDVRIYPDLLSRWTQTHFFPKAALGYLASIDPPKRLFNLYNWGGYLMLHAPGVPVFIDGRANTIYSERVYSDYQRMAGGADGYRALLARYRVDMVLMPHRYPLTTKLLTGPDAWRPIYTDRGVVLLVPPDSDYLRRRLPNPDLLVGDRPERAVLRSRQQVEAGRFDEAETTIESLIRRYPLYLPIYSELAAVRANAGDVDGMSRAIERGIREYPREAPQLREMEAFFLARFGRIDQAIEALRAAEPKGPFRNPSGVRRRIEQLERSRSGGPGAAARPG